MRRSRAPWVRAVCHPLCLLAAAVVLTSCAHYRLGTGTELTFSRLYVAPVENEALVPQASALVTREIRAAFLRDGRVELVDSPEAADVTLTLTLSDYSRAMTTAREQDTGLARKFDLTLEAQCTLRDQRTGTALFEQRPIRSTRQAFTDGDGFDRDGRAAPGGQLPAEYQTLPLLAEQLAQRITHAVLDVW